MDLIIQILAGLIGIYIVYFYITKFSKGLLGYIFALGMAVGLSSYLNYLGVEESVSRLTIVIVGIFVFSLDMIYSKIMREIKENNKL
ncbi:membrane protein [Staphylococcus phage Stab23]|nr:membrane protein [Staphylococcus phage Stab23]